MKPRWPRGLPNAIRAPEVYAAVVLALAWWIHRIVSDEYVSRPHLVLAAGLAFAIVVLAGRVLRRHVRRRAEAQAEILVAAHAGAAPEDRAPVSLRVRRHTWLGLGMLSLLAGPGLMSLAQVFLGSAGPGDPPPPLGVEAYALGALISILSLPCLIAGLVSRRSGIDADDEGVARRSLFREERVAWQEIGSCILMAGPDTPKVCVLRDVDGHELMRVPLDGVSERDAARFLDAVRVHHQAAPPELIAAEAPAGTGTEPEAAGTPAGRGTEAEAAPMPEARPVGERRPEAVVQRRRRPQR